MQRKTTIFSSLAPTGSRALSECLTRTQMWESGPHSHPFSPLRPNCIWQHLIFCLLFEATFSGNLHTLPCPPAQSHS